VHTKKQRVVIWLKPHADNAYPFPRAPISIFSILQTASFAHIGFEERAFARNKHQDMGQPSTRSAGTLLVYR